jgi:imidazole glycerol phosphate synthase glutamine amidotransferase subunit
MNLCKRVISRLDIKGTKLIKGIRFEGVRVIDNAYEVAKKYGKLGIDEIFYSDAVASLYERNSLDDLLTKTSKEVFVPITAGGAIKSVQDGRKLLLAGADKLAINTGIVKNPDLINELANEFGSQCVVVSIQARRSYKSEKWDVMIESGRERSNKDLFKWIEEVQDRGAGEIIITSVDNDGTGNGTDHELIETVSNLANVPLIFGGGISSTSEITKIFKNHKNISGISIGWGLHHSLFTIQDAHQSIKAASLPVKISSKANLNISDEQIDIVIADYGMGNLESLVNAIRKLNFNPIISSDENTIFSADVVILPGVGAFPEGMNKLKKSNLINPLLKRADEKKGIIGICLGMQLLFEQSEEYELCRGLGIIKGNITKLLNKNDNNESLILPHIGWNKLLFNQNSFSKEFKYFDSCYQYFVHTYGFRSENINNNNIIFSTKYGLNNFISCIKKDNIIGFQFHPERSGIEGLNLLGNAIKIITKR